MSEPKPLAVVTGASSGIGAFSRGRWRRAVTILRW